MSIYDNGNIICAQGNDDKCTMTAAHAQAHGVDLARIETPQGRLDQVMARSMDQTPTPQTPGMSGPGGGLGL